MRRSLAIAPSLLLTSGRAITDRLDITNHQLGTVNRQLGETNQRLGDAQARLYEVNRRLDETNRKLNTVEQAILQSSVLRPNPATPAPTPQPASPAR
jgi:septal ring factor EnvC (AmiA/AmiB activator)